MKTIVIQWVCVAMGAFGTALHSDAAQVWFAASVIIFALDKK